MENDILTTIIAVEREIQERLAAEAQGAAQTLDRLRRELEQEAAREGERLAACLRETVAAARAEAQGRADDAVRHASMRAEQLDRLDDETLQRYILKHLSRITREQDQ